MNEFDIIEKFFAAQIFSNPSVERGIGDDAAIVTVPPSLQLAITTDTLVAEVHFFGSDPPDDIGYKSLAVNLSDLAAMGAKPAWATMALTLPKINEKWIQSFCNGFFALANRYQVVLIGGDLTKGPLTITIQAMGFVHPQNVLLRNNAQSADLIYVTGTLGDASLALHWLQKKISLPVATHTKLLQKLRRPEPRIAVGLAISDIAHAAIDVSDGLASDLGHILKQSHVGAIIYVDQLPLSEEIKNSLPLNEAIEFALTGGDDYELCFTIPAEKKGELEKKLLSINSSYTCIGQITTQSGLDLRFQNGQKYYGATKGYQHF